MIRVASRIVNDFSYVMRINHEIHFAWQAQYLVKLEDDSCCFATLCSHKLAPPLPVKIRECNWDYNQVGSIGSVTLLKRVIATFPTK